MFPFKKITIAFIALLFTVVLCAADKMDNSKAASSAAEKWLLLADSGKYEESWAGTSAFLKALVPLEQWKKSLSAARGSFGKTLSRKLKSASHETSLPGAPDGEYFVMQFDSSFENKKTAVETITVTLEKNGTFSVAGYYIR